MQAISVIYANYTPYFFIINYCIHTTAR